MSKSFKCCFFIPVSSKRDINLFYKLNLYFEGEDKCSKFIVCVNTYISGNAVFLQLFV